VIGKIFRLRLSAAGSGMAPPQQRRRGRAQAPSSAVTPPAPPPPPPPAPARPSRGKSLLELTNSDCRWPIGNPGDKRFHFCGEPGADIEQGIPYCQQHMQRAYVASAPKPEKTGSAPGGWHTISPGISASVWRMFRDAIARKERT
jgi:GcrA cell cycle regulator